MIEYALVQFKNYEDEQYDIVTLGEMTEYDVVNDYVEGTITTNVKKINEICGDSPYAAINYFRDSNIDFSDIEVERRSNFAKPIVIAKGKTLEELINNNPELFI